MTDETRAKRLVIAGASGVVGRHLRACAIRNGWDVTVLTRALKSEAHVTYERVQWDPKAASGGDSESIGRITAALDGADVVVNLAGATLAEGRLGEAHRRRIIDSRVQATRALVAGYGACSTPPAVWLQASAVGFYGETGDAVITESAPMGTDFFLADVCQRWEDEAAKAGEAGARLVVLRIGLVLADDAPAWQRMVMPIRMGVGGRLGPGTQWYGWITAHDLARACMHLIDNPKAEGAYNLSTPNPIRQRDMVRATAKRLNRPALFPLPAWAMRLAVGGVADQLVLPSCRVVSERLDEVGFSFDHGDFETALNVLV